MRTLRRVSGFDGSVLYFLWQHDLAAVDGDAQMSGIEAFFIFIAVIAITGIIFGGWVIFTVARGLFHGFAWLLDIQRPRREMQASSSEAVRCANARCHQTNPTAARFCRRCGTPLPQVQRVAVRRAAVW